MSTYTVRPAAQQLRRTNQNQNQNQHQNANAEHGTVPNRTTRGRTRANLRASNTSQLTSEQNHDAQRQLAIERMQEETNLKAIQKEEERRRKEEEKQAEKIREYERLNPSSKPHYLRAPASNAASASASASNEAPLPRTADELRQARLAKFGSGAGQSPN